MARIRTIKPEFPQSESMGRVSREARLCFILLWTLSDDAGRLRGNSRMLASLLYPYDSDANEAIEDWLDELEEEGCIVRYVINQNLYIQICKWLEHQKIDKPSASKLPEMTDDSRLFANPREDSLRNGREGNGVEGKGEGPSTSADAGDGVLSADEFMARWNATNGVVSCRAMSAKRIKLLKARLKDPAWADNLQAALKKFPLRCFANDPNAWKPDAEWILGPDAVSRILEGKYDWEKQNGQRKLTIGPGQRHNDGKPAQDGIL